MVTVPNTAEKSSKIMAVHWPLDLTTMGTVLTFIRAISMEQWGGMSQLECVQGKNGRRETGKKRL